MSSGVRVPSEFTVHTVVKIILDNHSQARLMYGVNLNGIFRRRKKEEVLCTTKIWMAPGLLVTKSSPPLGVLRKILKHTAFTTNTNAKA
jgi:hypothetical protein